VAAVVRNLPWFEHSTSVSVDGRSIVVKPEQIVLWISVAEWGVSAPQANAPRFPAILDTGCNHNLVLQERHLVEWAGIRVAYLQPLGAVRVSGRRATRLAAHVWVHRNRNGTRDELLPSTPFLLEMPVGIAVVPESTTAAPFPRLPLLGLRAFRVAGLQMHIDCWRCRVGIRTRRWLDVFG
jgi:hypothetical protein